jgi:hypothetical protein
MVKKKMEIKIPEIEDEILNKIIENLKENNLELDGVILVFTRKTDNVTGSYVIAKDVGAKLRLLEEAKILRRQLDIYIETAIQQDMKDEYKDVKTKSEQSYLG